MCRRKAADRSGVFRETENRSIVCALVRVQDKTHRFIRETLRGNPGLFVYYLDLLKQRRREVPLRCVGQYRDNGFALAELLGKLQSRRNVRSAADAAHDALFGG